MASAVKSNPEKWKRIVASVKAGSKGGKPGQWSAVKAMVASKRYKGTGGGYSGPKATTSNNSLKKWQSEKWKTSDGKPAIRKSSSGKTITTRFLPSKAWDKLSSSEVKATNAKKIRSGVQFVSNTKAAKSAGKQARS